MHARVSDHEAALAGLSGGAATVGWVLWAQNGLLVLQIIATTVAIVAGIVAIRRGLRRDGG